MIDTRGTVGSYLLYGKTNSMVYAGKDKNLKGKAALVGLGLHIGNYAAQFDDIETGYGYGWHRFHGSDFQAKPPVED